MAREWSVCVVLLGCLIFDSSVAGADLDKVDRAADRVLERFRRRGREKIKDTLPSDWLVAAALCARGEFGAAWCSVQEGEAKSASICGYVSLAEQEKWQSAPSTWAILRKANGLRLANAPRRALEVLATIKTVHDPVQRVLYHSERSRSMMATTDPSDAAVRETVVAARYAWKLGWRRETNELLRRVADKYLGRPYTYSETFLRRCRAVLRRDEAAAIVGTIGHDVIAIVVRHAETRYVPLCSVEELRSSLPMSIDSAAEPVDKKGLEILRARFSFPAGVRRILLFTEREVATHPYSLLFPDKSVCQAQARHIHLLGEVNGARPTGSGALAIGTGELERYFRSDLGEERVVVQNEATVSAFRRGGKHRWRLIHIATPCTAEGDPCFVVGPQKARQRVSLADVFGFWWQADVLVFSGDRAARLIPFSGELSIPRVPTSRDLDGAEWRDFRRRLEAVDAHLKRTRPGPFSLIREESPRLLVTLWRTDPIPRVEFLSAFLRSWRDGNDAGTAFHVAQKHVKSDVRWRHAHYWATWQFWGRSR